MQRTSFPYGTDLCDKGLEWIGHVIYKTLVQKDRLMEQNIRVKPIQTIVEISRTKTLPINPLTTSWTFYFKYTNLRAELRVRPASLRDVG